MFMLNVGNVMWNIVSTDESNNSLPHDYPLVCLHLGCVSFCAEWHVSALNMKFVENGPKIVTCKYTKCFENWIVFFRFLDFNIC